ncbi:hypothetical protein C9F09_01900, partial [Salmonella enterica subsp. enterica serovar Wilhelmsburg]
LRPLPAAESTADHRGGPTVSETLKALEKPGRDPRPEFKTAQFADGVETMNALMPGMILDGAVPNVTFFGEVVVLGGPQG